MILVIYDIHFNHSDPVKYLPTIGTTGYVQIPGKKLFILIILKPGNYIHYIKGRTGGQIKALDSQPWNIVDLNHAICLLFCT